MTVRAPAAPKRPPRWSLATPRTEVRQLSPLPLRPSTARAPRLSRRLFSESLDTDRFQMHIPSTQSFPVPLSSQPDFQDLASSLLASHAGPFVLPTLDPLPSEDPVLTHTSWLDLVQPLSQPHFTNDSDDIPDPLAGIEVHGPSDDISEVKRKLELGVETKVSPAEDRDGGPVPKLDQYRGIPISEPNPSSALMLRQRENGPNIISQQVTDTDACAQLLNIESSSTEKNFEKNEDKGLESIPVTEDGAIISAKFYSVKPNCEKANVILTRSSSDATIVHVPETVEPRSIELFRGIVPECVKEQDCERQGQKTSESAKAAVKTSPTNATKSKLGSLVAQTCDESTPINTGLKHKDASDTFDVTACKKTSSNERRKTRSLSKFRTEVNHNQLGSLETAVVADDAIRDKDDAQERGNSTSSSGTSFGSRKKKRRRKMSEVLRLQKSLATASWTDSVAVEEQTTEIPIEEDTDDQASNPQIE